MRLLTALFLSTLAVAACSKHEETQPAPQAAVTAPAAPQGTTSVAIAPASPAPAATPAPRAPIPLPATVPTTGQIMTKTTFNCSDKVSFAAQFESGPNQVRLTLGKLAPLVLAQVYTPSGFWYRGDKVELRGKGRQATLIMAGRKPVTCTATQ